jgi:hypothetical protein
VLLFAIVVSPAVSKNTDLSIDDHKPHRARKAA